MAMYPHTYFLPGLLPIHPGCKREDYPLLNARVHYDLSDVQMLANLSQTYTSNASITAEIRYVFPLPADASVCAFKAVIDGERTIKGVVKEKAKAKAEYDQAVGQGKTAALLEQDNVEIFQVSLGNIRPKQTIEVHISFVSLISHEGSLDSLRLTFPSTIAPRYGTPPSGMFTSSGFKHTKEALDFSVAVEMTSHIKSITSPSHPIAMKLGESTAESSNEFNPTKARVSLSSPALLEKDIVLVLSCQDLDKPRCTVESFSPEEGGKEHTDAYALTLVPRFDLPSLPTQEYIFLVDRSGSMGGGKMDAVRSALQILLMSLPSRGTFFNIMSFGSRHSSLWPSSATYSADSVKTASAHVDTMSADFGGTEILEAIEAAFASRIARPNGKTTSTSVFVLTDGQAYDLDGVQSAIQDAVAKAKAEGLLLRVFCMGIGNAVSKAMCDKIGRAGKGTTAFVGEEEKPDQKLMGLLRAARGAVVEDISIDWGVGDDDTSETDGQDFEMIPSQEGSPESPKDATPISLFDPSNNASSEKEKISLGPQIVHVKLPPPPRVQKAPATDTLPPLYPGFRTSLFAIVRRGEGGDTAPSKGVRIKGSVLGRPVVLEVPVSQMSKSTADTPGQIKMLHLLAARALIQSIEDRAATSMSEVDNAEVLRIAERYGLASSQTSFVAMDDQGKPVDVVPGIEKTVAEDLAWSTPVARHLSLSLGGGGRGGRGGMGSRPAPGGEYSVPLLSRSRLQDVKSTRTRSMAPPPLMAAAPRAPSVGASSSKGGRLAKMVQIMGPGGASDDLLSSPSVESSVVSSEKSRKLFGSKKSKKSNHSPNTSSSGSSSLQSPSIETFARAQAFDGSFAGSASLFQILVRQSQAPAVPSALEGVGDDKQILWCTLLCVAYLETNFADDKEVWMILVEKAMRFVEDTLQDMGIHDVTARGQELKEAAWKCIA